MAARTLQPVSGARHCKANDPVAARSTLLTGCALVAATLALLPAWPGPSYGQAVSVTIPRISIQVPRVSVPRVSVDVPRVSVDVPRVSVDVPRVSVDVGHATAAISQGVGQVTAAVNSVVPNVRVDPSQLLATVRGTGGVVVDLPDVAISGGEIAANAAAAIAAVTNGLGNAPAAAMGNHGLAALVGPGGAGTHVQAHTGTITVGAATVLTVDFYGDGLINFAVDGPAVAAAADGSGAAVADGGTITITAAAASSIVDRAVNMDGVVQIQSIAVRGEQIALVVDAAAAIEAAPAASHRQVDPLESLLADASFRPGGHAAAASIRYGDAEPEPEPGGSAVGWTENGAPLFGAILGKPAEPLRPSPALLTPTGETEEDEELAVALTVLAQIDTVVGHEELTPGDICQSAGGGGVGLPGCGATESFGAVVSLAPDATADGCALLPGGGGIRLACGGSLDALPEMPGSIDLPAPALDSTTTLQDLMELWLRAPSDPADLPLALGNGLLASTAAPAILSLN